MNDLAADLRDLRLALSMNDLADVRRALATRLREGAAADGREIAMLPAWLAPPAPALRGDAVAIDAGGTHLRAAHVRVDDRGEVAVIGEIPEAPLPGGAGRPEASAAQLFEAHAALVTRLGAPPGCPIGYCFSYPSQVLPGGDAVLLRWTKEVRVHGVVGERVGALLDRQLRAAGLDPGPIFVLNDTIAALAAGSLGPGIDPARAVGLIVGTGSNLGAYLPLTALDKVAAAGWPSPLMAVNFESGAFSPPGLGPIDEEIDRASQQPGAQRFEKAVAGAYLGHLFSAAAKELRLPFDARELSSAEVSALALDDPGSGAAQLARALLDRSADLVAAALAATSDLLGGEGDLHVSAEGSLITNGPGHADRLRATLDALLAERGGHGRARLTLRRDANLIGAGLAALTHPRG